MLADSRFTRVGILVVAGVVAVSCTAERSNDAHTPPSEVEPTSTGPVEPATSAESTGESSAPTIALATPVDPPPISLEIPEGVVPPGITLSPAVVDLATLPPLPVGFVPISEATDIDVPDGMLTAPLLLSVAAEQPPAPNLVPGALHLDELGIWRAEPAVLEDGQLVVSATTFSIRILGWIDSAFDSASDWTTGRTDPPEPCDQAAYEWVSTSGAVANGTVHACTRANPAADGTERVEVVIKSNRNAFQWINIAGGTPEFVWVEGFTSGSRRLLASSLGLAADTQILLPPGATMTAGFTRPAESRTIQFITAQDLTSAAATAIYELLPDADFAAFVIAVASGGFDDAGAAPPSDPSAQLEARLAQLTFEEVMRAIQRLARVRAESDADSLVFLLDAGLDGHDVVQLASSSRRWQTAELWTRSYDNAGSLVLAADLLSRATTLAQDVLNGTIAAVNEYNVTLVVAPLVLPCAPTCEITGQATFAHPTWGPSRLIAASDPSTFTSGCSTAGHLYVVSDGTFRWAADMFYGCGERLQLLDPVSDSTGNLFASYNPGRYGGIIALKPTANGIDDLGTLWDDSQGTGRFYSAVASDTNADGALEIEVDINDCDPDCAGGGHSLITYTWDGDDYIESGRTQMPSQAAADHGGDASDVLKRGDTGDEVLALQHGLQMLGYLTDEPDGIYGPRTEAAVRAFQADHGLEVDGLAGPTTRRAVGETAAATCDVSCGD